MDQDNLRFDEVLAQFIEERDYTLGYLSRRTEQLFGHRYEIPRATINRWRQGIVTRPQSWERLLALAGALSLERSEANRLLQSAQYPELDTLLTTPTNHDNERLLNHWQSTKAVPQSLFQALPKESHFVGRAKIIDQIKKRATGMRHQRICCLSGMGGVGKTTLANYLAHDLRDVFPDGVLWVGMTGNTSLMAALHLVAEAYGVDTRFYPDTGSLGSCVRQLLGEKKALLILDDVQPEFDLTYLLPPEKGCFVLITTRYRNLPVMREAFCCDLEPFDRRQGESITFFSLVLGSERLEQERDELEQIADRLGHLPLAVAIAANWMIRGYGRSAASFLYRISRQGEMFHYLKEGYRGVRSSFELSFATLSPEQQQFFAALGSFSGDGFSVQAAAAVAGVNPLEAEDMLYELHDLCLVVERRSGRYQLHPLLRDFSQTQQAHPEWVQRLVHFYVDYTLEHAGEYDALALEARNILSALDVAFAQEMAAEYVRGILAWFPYLLKKGMYAEAQTYLKQASTLVSIDQDAKVYAEILTNQAHILHRLGNTAEAEFCYHKVLAVSRPESEHTLTCAALLGLGALLHRKGEFAQAKPIYEEGFALAQKGHDNDRMAAFLTNLGLLMADQGECVQAELYYRQALPLAHTSGNRQRVVTLLQNIGVLKNDQGNYKQAQLHFEEGLQLAQMLDDPELQSRLLGNLGMAYLHQNKTQQARQQFEYGLNLARQIGHQQQICRQLANLGRTANHQRQYNSAWQYFEESLALARAGLFRHDVCRALIEMAEIAMLLTWWDKAEAAFYEAHMLASESNLKAELARCQYGMATIAARLGNAVQARQLGIESLRLFKQVGNRRAEEVRDWLHSQAL